jgi:TP901 family phage tail tape measure protein
MAKKINSRDLFEQEDIFKGIRESADKTIQKLDGLKDGLKNLATETKRAFQGIKLDNLQDINKLLKLVEKANELNKQALALDKARSVSVSQKTKAEIELQMIEQQRLKTQQEQLKTNKIQSQEEARLNREREKAAKVARDQNNAYKELERNTRELKNRSKELGAEMLKLESEGRKNSSEYRKLANTYRAVTEAAKQGDTQLKHLDKTVGDNFRNVGNYQGAINKLRDGLGQLGLAFGIGSVVQSGTKAIIEFDQAIADLKAITGAGGADLEFYKQQANELGIAVEGGGAAVIEAYKLIGSAKPELLENAEALNEVTKSAILLSQASGMELPEAATALTDAMNQFGASASETERFVNVLAAGAKFGSAEIPQITEALLKFGAVSRTTNVSIEESTAAIELLAEKGLKGAEAGTALRNIMLKLSAPDALPKEAQERLEGLGISMEKLKDTSIPFADRLDLLKPLLSDAAAMTKVFGLENEVAAINIIGATDRMRELSTQVTNTTVAQDQAADRTNTLGHAITELKNAFFALFTTVGSGQGSMQMIIDSLKWLAKNLPMIVSWVWKIGRAWLIYKGTITALATIEKIRNTNFKDFGRSLMGQIPMTRAYRLEQIQLARAQQMTQNTAQQAGGAVKGFGSAISSIGWMAIIGILVELAVQWYNVASGTAEARRQQDLYEKNKQKGIDKANQLSEQTRKQYDEEIRKNELLYRTQMANASSVAEKKRLENEMNEKNIAIQQKYVNIEKNRGKVAQDNLTVLNKALKAVEAADEARTGYTWAAFTGELPEQIGNNYADAMKVMKQFGLEESRVHGREADQLREQIEINKQILNQSTQDRKTYNDIVEESTVSQLEANQSVQDYSVHITDNSGRIKTNLNTHNELNQELENYITNLDRIEKYLTKQDELLWRIKEAQDKAMIDQYKRDIDKEYQNQLKLMEATGDFDATKLNELINKKADLEIQYLKDKDKFEKDQIDKKYDYEMKARAISLAQEKQKLIAEAEDTRLRNLEIAGKDKKKIQEAENKHQKALSDINANYDIRYQELDAEEQKRYSDLQLEKVAISEETNRDIEDVNRDRAESIEKKEEDLTNKTIDNEKKKADARQKSIEETVKYITDLLIRQSEKRIAQYEKEIAAAEKNRDALRDLANSGNIDAKESLAEQDRIIAESNKRKEKEIRKQERIKLASTVYETYGKNVANLKDGEKSSKALGDTIRDISLLQAFISSLPAFEKGIEDTGSNGQGVDGKGGFHAILHPNERVIPKSMNERIGNISNEQLTKIATEYQNNRLVNSDQNNSSALDFALLLNKLDQVNQTIKEKPESYYGLGEVTQSMIEIIDQKKKGNTITYNRYRVRK